MGELRVRARPGRWGLGPGPDPLLRLRVPLCAFRGGERVPLPVGGDLRHRRLRGGDRRGDGHLRRAARPRSPVRLAQARPALELTTPLRAALGVTYVV